MSSCINLGINVNICDDGGLHLIRNVEKICHLVNVNTPCIHKYSDVDNFYTVFWLQEKTKLSESNKYTTVHDIYRHFSRLIE